MPEDPEELALQLNGKKSNLRKKNFLAFAENAGIAPKAAEAMIRDQLKNLPKWRIMCEESLLPGKMKQALSDLMSSRAARLE
jgi:serine/threonine-protein kinase HipA